MQSQFVSQYKDGCKKFKRLNKCIERDLNRYGRDDTLTMDLYKDEQRKEAYNILDRVEMSLSIKREIIEVTNLHFISSERTCIKYISLNWLCVVYCI